MIFSEENTERVWKKKSRFSVPPATLENVGFLNPLPLPKVHIPWQHQLSDWYKCCQSPLFLLQHFPNLINSQRLWWNDYRNNRQLWKRCLWGQCRGWLSILLSPGGPGLPGVQGPALEMAGTRACVSPCIQYRVRFWNCKLMIYRQGALGHSRGF